MNPFDRLRRKRIYILPSANASMVSRYADGHRAGRAQGYAAGLDAAREAVAAECHHVDSSEWCVYTAAIDALREEKP